MGERTLKPAFGPGRAAAAALLIATLGLAAPAQAADPRPFGHDCNRQNGTLFCPTERFGQRVSSFDRAPLDVDVTLPVGTERGEPLPTIVMMHGWGGNKTDFETESSDGDDPTSDTLFHYNNVYFARQGYAVVNYSARGFGDSCGTSSSERTPRCRNNRSYIHLADQRWEARDTQTLLGKLVRQEITKPREIGVTGISYGGGQSVELAYLKNRIRKRDGSFARWESPDGRRMKIAAAYPRWPWSDLVYSLQPNGRFLDFDRPTERESRSPLGIMKESYVSGLYALGKTSGTYCGDTPETAPCRDRTANINRWYARVQQGEPADGQARRIAREIAKFHQGFGIDGRRPAPMLLQSGWTDDLFPAPESIRAYNDVRSKYPNAKVAMQFGDLGHARGSNKQNSDRFFNNDAAAFFRANLKNRDPQRAPRAGEVTAFTQTCPQGAPADGPFQSSSYGRLDRDAFRMRDEAGGLVSPASADTYGIATDPIENPNACSEVSDDGEPAGTVVVRRNVSDGFTLMGLPTVRARIDTTGVFGQLDSRLWDVDPDTNLQTLVSRGAYRLRTNQDGHVTFQLHGNGYCFAEGHEVKLQLLGKDAPFLRPTTTPFASVAFREIPGRPDIRVNLPTAERDADSGCRTP